MEKQNSDKEIREQLEEKEKIIKELPENQESKEMKFSKMKDCDEEMKKFVI